MFSGNSFDEDAKLSPAKAEEQVKNVEGDGSCVGTASSGLCSSSIGDLL